MANNDTAPRFCTGCGNPLASDDQFCGVCGKPVVRQTPVQSSLNPQPLPTEMPQVSFATPPAKKKFSILTVAIVCVLVVCVGLLAVLLFSGEEDEYTGRSNVALDRNKNNTGDWEKDDHDASDFDDSGDTTCKTYKVGVAIYQYNDNFMTLYRQEIEAYFKTLETDSVKYDITFVDGKNDMTEQTAQIENFIAQKMDVIICNLVRTSSAEVIIDMVVAADIPLVLINREPLAYDADGNTLDEAYEGILNNPKVCYVGANSRQPGTLQGQIVLNLPDHGDVNGDGVVKYVMIEGSPESIDAQYRTEYSIEALIYGGMAVECLVDQIGNWEQAKGQEITAYALAKYGMDIDVIFCNNDAMAIGAASAIQAAGRKVGEDIYLVGVDALDQCVQMVADGTMTGTVENDYIGQSHTAVDAAVRLLNGMPVDDYYWVDYIIVDENYVGYNG